MAKYETNTVPSVPNVDADIEAAFDACGSSPEALRARVLACRRAARGALDAQLERSLAERGFDARELCARELGADLANVTVCELLQTVAIGRKDAIIDVFRGELAGRIWCSGGAIVDATSGRLTGKCAVYRIVALDQGEVVVDFRPVRRARALGSPTQALLMEALRRKDECVVLEKHLGGAQSVYRSAPDAQPADTETRALEQALLGAFKSGARVASVLACSAVDDLTLLQVLAKMVERGCLVRSPAAPRLVADDTVRPTVALPSGPVRRRDSMLRPLSKRRAIAALTFAGVAGACLVWAVREASAPRARAAAAALPPVVPDGPRADSPPRAVRPAAPADPASPRAPASSTPGHTYPIRLVVEPSNAELWLDGTWLTTGELAMILARDGRTHELRITAPGHDAQTFLFRDAPPPRAVVLQPADAGATQGGRSTPPSERGRIRANPGAAPVFSRIGLPRGTPWRHPA